MTARADFITALDERPHDQVLRAVFADWLEENGDGDGDVRLCTGLRWMVENGKWPLRSRDPRNSRYLDKWCWRASYWWNAGMTDTNWIPHTKSVGMETSLMWRAGSDRFYAFNSRHEAEVALADARWDLGHRP